VLQILPKNIRVAKRSLPKAIGCLPHRVVEGPEVART
jgi:hypothetical protein